MKASEIIRGVLDLIDQIDCASAQEPVVAVQTEPAIQTGVDTSRFKHILAMLDVQNANPTTYDNTPNEVVAHINAVTKDAGGGWNGPKNPADMRANSVSMYPNFQAKE